MERAVNALPWAAAISFGAGVCATVIALWFGSVYGPDTLSAFRKIFPTIGVNMLVWLPVALWARADRGWRTQQLPRRDADNSGAYAAFITDHSRVPRYQSGSLRHEHCSLVGEWLAASARLGTEHAPDIVRLFAIPLVIGDVPEQQLTQLRSVIALENRMPRRGGRARAVTPTKPARESAERRKAQDIGQRTE